MASLTEKQQATAAAARDGARELCEAVGPAAIAAEYGTAGHTEHEIAVAFAEAAYNDKVFDAAYKGAIDGFRIYASGR